MAKRKGKRAKKKGAPRCKIVYSGKSKGKGRGKGSKKGPNYFDL